MSSAFEDRSRFEDSVERQIRQAEERGDFDRLPGAGAPIPDIDRRYEPAWWARRLAEREREVRALESGVAATLAKVDAIWAMTDEATVMAHLSSVAAELAALDPYLDVESLLDQEALVRSWRDVNRRKKLRRS